MINDIYMMKYITEDGYIFTLQSDGTLTDGDITFTSLEEIKKYVDVEKIEDYYLLLRRKNNDK